MWPNWHKKYPFYDFYINQFAPDEPGAFYIFIYENEEIVYFGYGSSIKNELLKIYENTNPCIKELFTKGIRLGFSYFKAENPHRFYLQILESYNKLNKRNPKCQDF
ncbi:MAG: hypothetical protein N2504_03275 [candidate division WOR-3 bacterium]|nr:hypothetical protein [candidate division WOR-3 bacterium]MCX7947592.1 hypothetical protein [candidate division WOR-3 bacterium]MDW8150477.1 hypothetical protein [candidate division WOR-3 bacterium]